jgi:hypothetical protein
VVKPILERGGLVAGRDFFLAFSPERVDPGNQTWTTKNVPKVVGGTTADCTRLARILYSASIDRVVEVSSPKVAEMVKLLENTFRAVNIGLVNELALMCDRLGISVWEVVDAAATKPFGFMPFYPGPGLGGHCIPIDPFYLSWKVKEVGFEARFIELAGHVNGAMPHHVVDKVADALNSQSKAVRGSNILILGIAYKRDIDDIRESPALDVMAVLKQRGGHLSYHDPYAPHLAARDWPAGRRHGVCAAHHTNARRRGLRRHHHRPQDLQSPGDPGARASHRRHTQCTEGLLAARVQTGSAVGERSGTTGTTGTTGKHGNERACPPKLAERRWKRTGLSAEARRAKAEATTSNPSIRQSVNSRKSSASFQITSIEQSVDGRHRACAV